MKLKSTFTLIILGCLVITIIALYGLGGLDPVQVQGGLRQTGVWAPIIYITLYIIITIFVFPSTPLNLTSGVIFGLWFGTLWTTIAAVIAAVIAFLFARTVGHRWVKQRLSGQWDAIDGEISQGGVFYMFAIRLQPVIPYGLVNFAAGVTSVRFRDFLLGTTLGTPPGILPYVWIGSSGLKAIKTGDVIPLMGALALAAALMGGGTWFYRHLRIK
ncbi:MAG: TVP38/TMEM64 family protein [Cyanobacteria bacterium WB6_1B_304]|jgi:uncharacterized membrane protein YdjX (TVP38/TMEM64 family)|nr:TVP38/TMEM64 family protein [Cyanobacteria bacterium WB6_1B_304]